MITKEWARQLAFDLRPGDISSETNVLFVPDCLHYHVPIHRPTSKDFIDNSWLVEYEVEEIRMDTIYDANNEEITKMGYGPKSLLIVVGSTKKNEAIP